MPSTFKNIKDVVCANNDDAEDDEVLMARGEEDEVLVARQIIEW